MTRPLSVPARLDSAIDRLLATGASGAAAAATSAGGDLAPLVRLAAELRAALTPPPVAPRFEARLGARLAGATPLHPFGWALRHPGLMVTGAVGSAAVGVGVTAYAVWRSRHPVAAARRVAHR